MSDASPKRLGAVLYPGFEMLDMFGPLEMFSVLGPEVLQITMLAEHNEPVSAAMGMDIQQGPRVAVDATFADAPPLDILLVPGGFGTLPELDNPAMLEFLAATGAGADYVCSVCTGSLLLARAGLLDGRRATTNKQFFSLSKAETAPVDWVTEARWVEDGKFFTSSGVSAGMDMALSLIAQLYGEETAVEIANGSEYSWHRDAESDPFAAFLDQGMVELTAD
ncbi:MAG: DJ-1/PfpI family protein [Pseudomonadota bacterium]